MKRVLFVSPAAAASHVMLELLQKTIEKNGDDIEVHIDFFCDSKSDMGFGSYDLIMLSPHFRFLLNRRDSLQMKKDARMMAISSMDFGDLNGGVIYSKIKEGLAKK